MGDVADLDIGARPSATRSFVSTSRGSAGVPSGLRSFRKARALAAGFQRDVTPSRSLLRDGRVARSTARPSAARRPDLVRFGQWLARDVVERRAAPPLQRTFQQVMAMIGVGHPPRRSAGSRAGQQVRKQAARPPRGGQIHRSGRRTEDSELHKIAPTRPGRLRGQTSFQNLVSRSTCGNLRLTSPIRVAAISVRHLGCGTTGPLAVGSTQTGTPRLEVSACITGS